MRKPSKLHALDQYLYMNGHRKTKQISTVKCLEKKEFQTHVFSCEICEISMNTFFYRTLPVAASVISNLRELVKSVRFVFDGENENLNLPC